MLDNVKYLVTSGCSFTETYHIKTWPHWLNIELNTELSNYGIGCQGNSLIARKAVYGVTKLLQQGIPAQDIILGIMWSGDARTDSYFSNVPNPMIDKHKTDWQFNPVNFLDKPIDTTDTRELSDSEINYLQDKNPSGGWVVMNHNWQDKYSKAYYGYMYDNVNSVINTYEKCLWVQNFCQANNIKYFMSQYIKDSFFYKRKKDDKNIKWMHNSIDWQMFLPVEGCYEWCTENTELDREFIEQGLPMGGRDDYQPSHPEPEHHDLFVKKVILPFLKEKYA